MKLFLSIVLNTVIALAIIYLLIVIMDVTFVISFSSIMRHHANDLTVILTNKRDNLAKLADFLLSQGIKLDKKKVESVVKEWLENSDKGYFLVDVEVSDDSRIVVEIDHAEGVWSHRDLSRTDLKG